MKKIIYTLILCLLCINQASGQDISGRISVTVPTSPQAESFKRYGEYRVNNFTGTPDISIPLFTIEHQGYTIPLELRYQPLPIKPGYNYDVFGHGWNFSANSSISRTIKSLPDESANFNIQTNHFSDYFSSNENVFTGYNLEPDRYNVVLPNGTAFEFAMFNQNGILKYVTSNSDRVKISHTMSGTNIQAFTLIDSDGVKYTFSEPDASDPRTTQFFSAYISWNLTRIDLPHSDQPILYTYNKQIQTKFGAYLEEAGMLIKDSRDGFYNPRIMELKHLTSYDPYCHKMRLLTSISYGTTSITLNYQDPDPNNVYNYVDDIYIRDSGAIVRRINLQMQEKPFNFAGYNRALAKLTRLAIGGPNVSGESLVYKCQYSTPTISFRGTDHWGFGNGFDNKKNVAFFNVFLPFRLTDIPSQNVGQEFYRVVNKTSAELCPYDKITMGFHDQNVRETTHPLQHDVISRLTYPTGGYTDFEFENHVFRSRTNFDGSYILDPNRKRETRAGGFRVKKITNYTATGTRADVKTYRYGKTYAEAYADNQCDLYAATSYPNRHTGWGEATVDPTILTYMSHSSYRVNFPARYIVLGLDENGMQTAFPHPFYGMATNLEHYANEFHFSPANFRKLLNGRPAVVYDRITIYHGDIGDTDNNPDNTIGKTVCYYDVYETSYNALDGYGKVFFEAADYVGNTLSYNEKGFRYNNLKEKIDYKRESGAFTPVQKEKQSYTTSARDVIDYININTYPVGWQPRFSTIGENFGGREAQIGTSLPTSKSIVAYTSLGDSITTFETYSYDQYLHLSSKTNHNSNGASTTEIYERAQDNAEGTAPGVVQKMMGKNMKGIVLNTRQVCSAWHYGSIMTGGSRGVYDEVQQGNLAAILPTELYDRRPSYGTPVFKLNTKVLSHTPLGKPNEVVNADGIHSVYLWGYNGRYLIAEIKNATLAQVKQALNDPNGNIVNTLTPGGAPINGLRQSALLKDALITTFTHKPLIGVASVINPAGIAIYYEYDALGRLKETYRLNGTNKEVIEQYEYNYINQ